MCICIHTQMQSMERYASSDVGGLPNQKVTERVSPIKFYGTIYTHSSSQTLIIIVEYTFSFLCAYAIARCASVQCFVGIR